MKIRSPQNNQLIEAHEQGERQPLRRNAPQGPRQGLLRARAVPRPATAANEAALQAFGIEDDSYVVDDGSGLSYGNRLTAHGIVALLGAMSRRPGLRRLLRLALGGRRGRHQRGPHARHRRRRQRPRQDRDLERRRLPVGLRGQRQRPPDRVLDPHERRADGLVQGHEGAERHRRGPLAKASLPGEPAPGGDAGAPPARRLSLRDGSRRWRRPPARRRAIARRRRRPPPPARRPSSGSRRTGGGRSRRRRPGRCCPACPPRPAAGRSPRPRDP